MNSNVSENAGLRERELETHHEGTQIVYTVSIPESPLHFLRILV